MLNVISHGEFANKHKNLAVSLIHAAVIPLRRAWFIASLIRLKFSPQNENLLRSLYSFYRDRCADVVVSAHRDSLNAVASGSVEAANC
jgi:hypothetical protein